MRSEALAAARPHTISPTRTIFAMAAALVAALAAPAAPRAESSSTPLIKIPPAQLSPPPAKLTTTFQAVARTLLPTEMHILRDPEGSGIAMHGALADKATSAVGVLLAVFANSEAFDPTLSPPLVLADKDDQHAQALFTATVHGGAVTGVAAAALSDSGGEVTVIYDDTDGFAAAFPRLRQALAQDNAVQIGRSDNSISAAEVTHDINVDPGWQEVIASAVTPPSGIGNSPAQALADKLSRDTNEPWRIVPLSELR